MEYIILIVISQDMNKGIYSKEQKELIRRLKIAREEAGLDQNEVAKALGMTQSHVSKVESGQRRIDIIQLKAYAKIYKMPIEYFVK